MPLWPLNVRQIFQMFFASKVFMTLYYCITSFFGAPHFVLWTHCICPKFYQICALFTCFLLGAASPLYQMMLIKASIMELWPLHVVCVCTCLKNVWYLYLCDWSPRKIGDVQHGCTCTRTHNLYMTWFWL